MLKRITATIAAFMIAAALMVAAPVPAAVADDGSLTCSVNPAATRCTIDLTGSGDSGGPRSEATGFTPAPRVCARQNVIGGSGGATLGEDIVVPCEQDGSWWLNSQQCYVSISAMQGPPLLYAGQDGAYYDCQQVTDAAACANFDICGTRTTFWSATTPPGITTFTPIQAANQLVRSFDLTGINIGLAPDPNAVNSRGYVGLPIWMWVSDPTEASYGPYRVTETLGTVSITAEATTKSVLWNMGDGTTVSCATKGTAYQSSFGMIDSPNCGHRYNRVSEGQAGGQYTITATSQWEVAWQGGGANGVIPLTTEQTSNVDIRELQSVNVGN